MPAKPTKKDRAALTAAIENQDADLVTAILDRADETKATKKKKLLMMRDKCGSIPLHNACGYRSRSTMAILKLILDSAVQHKLIKKMLEEIDGDYFNCIIWSLLATNLPLSPSSSSSNRAFNVALM